jgi:phosphatidylserine decarboxylase
LTQAFRNRRGSVAAVLYSSVVVRTAQRPLVLSLSGTLRRIMLQEDVNFLVTNRIPRRLATRLMARLSRIDAPWWTRLSLRVWQLFADDLDLEEARKGRFESIHDCFIRELRQGARPIDPDPAVVVCPCDGVVGACGRVVEGMAIQAKGFPYALSDLLADSAQVGRFRDGLYVTLRIRSSMYHRFHAPDTARLGAITYISGDTWNVNPIALRRVERLFCKNERAVIPLALDGPGEALALVAVAAILVGSIKLHCLATPLDLDFRGAKVHACDRTVVRGEELGYFQSGSTIVLFASPGFGLVPGLREGATVRVGERLLVRPPQQRLPNQGGAT